MYLGKLLIVQLLYHKYATFLPKFSPYPHLYQDPSILSHLPIQNKNWRISKSETALLWTEIQCDKSVVTGEEETQVKLYHASFLEEAIKHPDTHSLRPDSIHLPDA